MRCDHDPLRPGRLPPMRRLPTARPRRAVNIPTPRHAGTTSGVTVPFGSV
jgi:hypothetical protein